MVVILGVVVLVVAIVALHEPKGRVSAGTGTRQTTTIFNTVTPSTTSPATSSSTSSSMSSSSSTSPNSSTSSSTGVKAIPLIVLNATSIPNVAGDAATKLRADGWTVTNTDNIVNNIVSTCAYYDPSVPGARAAAEALRSDYPWIKRTKERFAELPKGPVVLVLTQRYTDG